MKAVKYSESVSVGSLPAYDEFSVTAQCDINVKKRFNNGVKLNGPSWCPVNYRDKVTCYIDSTRRRYRSDVFYEARIKPKSFSDTVYVFPKNPEMSYITTFTQHPDSTRRWYKTSVDMDGPFTPNGTLISTWRPEGSQKEEEEEDDLFYSQRPMMNGEMNGDINGHVGYGRYVNGNIGSSSSEEEISL
ncbi:uncharacterized protein LOC106152093 [Lingula anatina]|uniref:Uncharacterized protein LOC106152093 n=1 Tax=Lingula anatina TaxID=7574 RepID=A0A1S3H4Z2_LINAN|nr:uncharacterized protein LOC106152093 [Lingula anatina]|eukprot:XP_013381037.1 uncharacterized protein LOC106152093 [Lingula anatina]